MKEKKVASLKIVFEDGSDYSVACEKGLDKDELAEYIERAFKPEPSEPLIKDEKIRKAVRAWAEANSLKWAAYSADGKFYDKTIDTEISFKTYTNRLDIPECKLLPIAELCGEEEE